MDLAKMDSEKQKETAPKQVHKKPSKGPWLGKRHLLAVLGFIGIFNIYTTRVNLSVAIVAMVVKKESIRLFETSVLNNTQNLTESEFAPVNRDVCEKPDHDEELSNGSIGFHRGPEFDWDTTTQGIILGSYFYGYIVTQLIGGWLSKRFGGKYPFGLGILFSGIFTVLIPVSSPVHYGLVIGLRIAQGLSAGICYPALQHMLAQWSPAMERTKLSTFVNSGAAFGNVFVLAISGILADFLGWESIFYIFGGLCGVWFVLWQVFVFDAPHKDPSISQAEMELITGNKKLADSSQAAKEASDSAKHQKVPWKNILTSAAVWAMVGAHFGQNWGNYTLLTNLPNYMSNILRFDLSANGLLSALPYVALWITGVLSGYISDVLRKRRVMTTTNVRKMFNTVGNIIPAFTLVAVAYVGCDSTTAVILLTIATGASGCTQSSYQVNSLDISPVFASVVYAVSNTIANVPGIVSPYTVGLITSGEDGQTLSNWKIIFYISAIIRLVTTLFYGIFASGEVASWNQEGQEPVGYQ